MKFMTSLCTAKKFTYSGKYPISFNNRRDYMKKILTFFVSGAIIFASQGAFAYYSTSLDIQNHHNDIYQTLNHAGGYTGAETQAAGGYAKEARALNTRGGFIAEETEAKFTTVLSAKRMGDNSYIKLKGKIVSKVGKEKYLFKDNTGTIQIEIDDEDWKGVQAGPKDLVIIEGELDKDWDSISIDVDTIELVK